MRSFISKFFFGLVLCLLGLGGYGQTDVESILETLSLNQALYPPEGILKTKSLVLLSTPEAADSTEWAETVNELQASFASQGVDAVAYIKVESLFSKPNQVLEIPAFLNQRDIENLILLTVNNDRSPIFLAIGKYNGESSFFNPRDVFWARKGDLTAIINELEQYFKTGSLVRENLLVNEFPEFFYPNVELGIVAKSIPPKLAEFKVAMEPVDIASFSEEGPSVFRYEKLYQADSFNNALRNRNYAIQTLVTDSTSQVHFKPEGKNNQALRQAGFQYELVYVSGRENRIYEWLPFPDRSAAKDRIIHKFYLKDLRNNNIYVGKEWDASEDWEIALQKFVAQMNAVISQKAN